eukprot:TRINITY_DN1378_c0_g3_i2.p1 TRINITY_DN1378_c0_g3~~TRINITY_DN1378_c0_g3_i2.p1  ORF type:complete len:359 (+),score=15.30 TRINITY_DN1378_c0_g3_i2:70-1146(+)
MATTLYPVPWVPANIYGLIVLIISFIIFPPFLIYQHMKRKTRFYVQRSYILLAFQNWGMFVSIIIYAAEQILHPYDPCIFITWVNFIGFTLYCTPVFLRCLVYCIRYHIARKRGKTLLSRPTEVMSSARILKLVFVISTPFAWKAYFAVGLPQLLPPIALTLLQKDLSHMLVNDPAGCPNGDMQGFVVFSFVLFHLINLALSVGFLWKSRDAYYIKREFRAAVIVWIIAIPIWGVGHFFSMVNFYLPKFTVIMIACLLHFCVSGVWISLVSYRYEKYCKGCTESDLATLLKDKKFAKRFSNFLCLQMCVENIYFYETVEAYRRAAENELPILSRVIYDRCIFLIFEIILLFLLLLSSY